MKPSTARYAIIQFLVLIGFALSAHADVTGTVVDRNGDPIEGALVRLVEPDAGTDQKLRWQKEDPALPVLAETRTDGKGNYSIEADRSLSRIVLEIDAKGHVPGRLILPHDGWVGAAVLHPATPKAGRVRSGSKAVAGALVIAELGGLGEIRARTGDQGQFELPLPESAMGTLSIIHPDFAPVTRPMRSGDDLNISLESGQQLSAKIVGPDGKTAVEGAMVSIDGWPVATTAADGTFTVAHAPAQWSTAEVRKGNLVAEVRRTTAKPVVSLRRAATINGSIVDAATGKAIAGIRVSLDRGGPFGPATGTGSAVDTATTDRTGSFSLAGILPGTYQLSASHPSWVRASEELTITDDSTFERRVQLVAAATIRGQAANESGDAVGGASITVRTEDRQPFRMRMMMGAAQNAARSAPDGRFVLFGVEPEQELRLEARHRRHPDARTDSFELDPGSTRSGQTIIFPNGVSLSGVVTTADGDPISGAEIHTSRADRGMGGNMRVVMLGGPMSDADPALTDAKGRFDVKLQQGTWNMSVQAKGFAPRQLNAVQVGDSNEPLQITLDEGVAIEGRVTREGIGVAEAMVSVLGSGQMRIPITTGPDGSFAVEDLAPGNATMIVAKPSEFIQEMRTVEAPVRDLVIDLPAGGSIRGRVVDASTKKAVTDFTAGPNPERGGGMVRVRTPGSLLPFHNEDGIFLVENVPPGRTELVVQAPGYLDQTIRGIEIVSGKTVEDLTVELERGVRVTGTVRGPDGKPVSGATVSIEKDEQDPIAAMIPGFGTSTVTSSTGTFTIPSVEPGEATFVFAKEGLVSSRKSVKLSGESATVDGTLSGGRTVRGVVVSSAGAPIANASVRAMSAGQVGRFDAVETDATGQFTLEGLADGRYTFAASHDAYVDEIEHDVDITSGQMIRLVMEQGGTITGRILGADPADYSAISVRSHSSPSSASVSPDGTFRLEGVEPGSVTVSASMRRMLEMQSTQPKTVELAAGSTVSVDLEFSGGSTVTGRVTRFGEPLTSGMVRFAPSDRSSGGNTANVGADGRYTIGGLAPGRYEVTVMDLQSFSPFSKQVEIRSDNETVDIDIRGGKVTGRVTDASTGEPVAEASVFIEQAESSSRGFLRNGATTGSSGEFAIDAVAEGSYRLRVEKGGYGQASRDLFVTEGREESVDVSLQPSAGLTLLPVDRRDGRPLSVDAIVWDAGNQVTWEGRPSPREDGSVRIPVAAGTYRVSLYANGYAPATVQVTTPGATQRVPMSTGGTLVIESRGSERKRAVILDAWGGPARASRWNRSGEVWLEPGRNSFDNLAPGQYSVRLLDSGETQSVTIQEGSTATLTM